MGVRPLAVEALPALGSGNEGKLWGKIRVLILRLRGHQAGVLTVGKEGVADLASGASNADSDGSLLLRGGGRMDVRYGFSEQDFGGFVDTTRGKIEGACGKGKVEVSPTYCRRLTGRPRACQRTVNAQREGRMSGMRMNRCSWAGQAAVSRNTGAWIRA